MKWVSDDPDKEILSSADCSAASFPGWLPTCKMVSSLPAEDGLFLSQNSIVFPFPRLFSKQIRHVLVATGTHVQKLTGGLHRKLHIQRHS